MRAGQQAAAGSFSAARITTSQNCAAGPKWVCPGGALFFLAPSAGSLAATLALRCFPCAASSPPTRTDRATTQSGVLAEQNRKCRVRSVHYRLSGTKRESLKLKGFSQNRMRRGNFENRIALKSLAIPAGAPRANQFKNLDWITALSALAPVKGLSRRVRNHSARGLQCPWIVSRDRQSERSPESVRASHAR